jgi:hypothetical protein
MKMKIAMLYYEVSQPVKSSHNLKVRSFKVSIHESIEDAHFCAYYYHGLACKEYDTKDVNYPMFNHHFPCSDFRFALFFNHCERSIYSSNKSDFNIKKEAWRIYQDSLIWGNYEDCSMQESDKIPIFIMPEGYEIMKEGIIDETCMLFFSGNIRTDSEYVQRFAEKFHGRDVSEVCYLKTSKFTDIRGKVTIRKYMSDIIIRPVKN